MRVAQGVSGQVKARMEAAASGTDGGARPMLLFPEVHAPLNSCVTANLLPSDHCLQHALREPQQMDSTCFPSKVEHFLLGRQCSLSFYNMARYALVGVPG